MRLVYLPIPIERINESDEHISYQTKLHIALITTVI